MVLALGGNVSAQVVLQRSLRREASGMMRVCGLFRDNTTDQSGRIVWNANNRAAVGPILTETLLTMYSCDFTCILSSADRRPRSFCLSCSLRLRSAGQMQLHERVTLHPSTVAQTFQESCPFPLVVEFQSDTTGLRRNGTPHECQKTLPCACLHL